MKALVAIAALLAAVSLAVIGCSDGGSDRAEPAPTQPPATTEATTTTEAPVPTLEECGRAGEEKKFWVPAFLSSTKVNYCLPATDGCGEDENARQRLIDNFNASGEDINPNGWQLKLRQPAV